MHILGNALRLTPIIIIPIHRSWSVSRCNIRYASLECLLSRDVLAEPSTIKLESCLMECPEARPRLSHHVGSFCLLLAGWLAGYTLELSVLEKYWVRYDSPGR
jgi:hypothetical protein